MHIEITEHKCVALYHDLGISQTIRIFHSPGTH